MKTFPFILIVGPTASGKTALGLELAQRHDGAILNCDSLQFYQELNIGTAKPTPQELALVPHYLIDVLKPGQNLTAGDFRKAALEILKEQLSTRPVFGVGGSGFYIQALERGMFDIEKPRPEIEQEVRRDFAEKGLAWLYAELTRLDPEYAEDINPNDAYRIQRGLVILRDSGRKPSELKRDFQKQTFPFPLIKLGLAPTREQLEPRVRERTRQMLERGLIAEVERLLLAGWQDWAPLQSIGYRETVQFLRGQIERERLEPLIVEKTLQLAKKQRTWFKRDSQIHWLDFLSPLPSALKILQSHL